MATQTQTRRKNILLVGYGLGAFSLGAVVSQILPDLSDPIFFFYTNPAAARAFAAGDQWGYYFWSIMGFYVAPALTWLSVLAVALWKGPSVKQKYLYALAIIGSSVSAGIIFLLATGRWHL